MSDKKSRPLSTFLRRPFDRANHGNAPARKGRNWRTLLPGRSVLRRLRRYLAPMPALESWRESEAGNAGSFANLAGRQRSNGEPRPCAEEYPDALRAIFHSG